MTEPSSPPAHRPRPSCRAAPPRSRASPSDAVLAMVRRWEREGNEPHGVVVIRHGHVVAEGAWQPWPRDGIRLVYSVSKTFLAIAAAFAEAEGLLARDERLVDVFPEAAAAAGPARRPDHRRGLPADVDRSPRRHPRHRSRPRRRRARSRWRPSSRAEPEEEPGLVVPVPQRREPGAGPGGAAAHRRAAARLPPPPPARPDRRHRGRVDPLGRQPTSASAACTSAPSTVARLGLLLLARRRVAGPAVLPAGWVATASSALADTIAPPRPASTGRSATATRCGAAATGFRADGAYGQFALVLPEHDLVVAVTSCTETTHEVLDAVWDELLPHLADAPLPADPDAQARLVAALEHGRRAGIRVDHTAPPRTPARGPSPTRPTPEHPALRSVEVRPGEHGWVLEVDDGGRCSIACGDGHWPDAGGSPWVASGGWVAPGVFEATVVAARDPALAAAALRATAGDRALARRPAARPRPGPAAGTRGLSAGQRVAGWCRAAADRRAVRRHRRGRPRRGARRADGHARQRRLPRRGRAARATTPTCSASTRAPRSPSAAAGGTRARCPTGSPCSAGR